MLSTSTSQTTPRTRKSEGLNSLGADGAGSPISAVAFDELATADAVRKAVLTVEGIVALSKGAFGQIATYGPGKSVPGVVLHRSERVLSIEVHVVAQYRPDLCLLALADQVRLAVHRQIDAGEAGSVQQVDVAFDDLCL